MFQLLNTDCLNHISVLNLLRGLFLISQSSSFTLQAAKPRQLTSQSRLLRTSGRSSTLNSSCMLESRSNFSKDTYLRKPKQLVLLRKKIVQLYDGASPESLRIHGRFPNPKDVHSHKLWDFRFPEFAAQERKKLDCPKLTNDKRTIVHDVISRSDASNLADLLTSEIASKLEDPAWCAEHKKGSGYLIRPLLIPA